MSPRLCGFVVAARNWFLTNGRNHRGTETQSFFTFFQEARSPLLFFVLCASASLWFRSCSVSKNHRGTETQSFFYLFSGNMISLPFFVLCASASLWFRSCSVSKSHRGTETQSLLPFKGARCVIFFWFSVTLWFLPIAPPRDITSGHHSPESTLSAPGGPNNHEIKDF